MQARDSLQTSLRETIKWLDTGVVMEKDVRRGLTAAQVR